MDYLTGMTVPGVRGGLVEPTEESTGTGTFSLTGTYSEVVTSDYFWSYEEMTLLPTEESSVMSFSSGGSSFFTSTEGTFSLMGEFSLPLGGGLPTEPSPEPLLMM